MRLPLSNLGAARKHIMRKTLLSFIEEFNARRTETAFAHRQGLRVIRWSRERVQATAFQFARELEARSIRKGDRVLVWAKNSPEWVAAFFGCLLRGVVAVPLDVQSAPDFVARVMQQTVPKLLLLSDGRHIDSTAQPAVLRLDQLSHTVACHSAEPYEAEHIIEDDLVEIIYTSGTTAEPKGVCLTHRNFIANITPLEEYAREHILRWEPLVHPIRLLNLLPLSHVFGQLMGLFVPHLIRGETFFQDSLNPTEIIDTVRHERITGIVTVPRLLDTLRGKIEREWDMRGEAERFHKALAKADGWHFLRRWWVFRRVHRQFGWKFWGFVSGGATLSSDTEEFWRRLGSLVVQGYGMTETASLISYNDPFQTTRGSIGRTLPDVEVKLDESGEILVRGSNVSPGYWREGVTPMTEEGWLHTGDLGEMDARGNLYFKGRKKDVIATAAGIKIHPEDIEAVLNRDEGVRDSAVVGIEGPLGPEAMAVLLLRDEQSDAEAIIKRANERLGPHQQIRRWFVWTEKDFPRTTATRKVRKRDMVEAVKAGVLSASVRRTDQPGSLAEIIARISRQSPQSLGPSANVATDLKLDSIGRVELLGALEDRYQIELDEAAFSAATTLGDIEKMVHENALDQARPYPYPEWPQHFPATLIRLIMLYLLILPLTRLIGWVRVRGKENLRAVQGPAIFICNHVAMVDPALVISVLPGRFRRRLAIAMIGELLRDWRHPARGTSLPARLFWRIPYWLALCLFNAFSLPQESGFRRSFSFAGRLVDRGYNLLIFPEGQRTHDGQMNPFMAGTGLLAAGLNVQIVPMKITGLFELKQRRRFFARPGEVALTYGEPVSYKQGEDPARITKDLERRVMNLCDKDL
jgi:long-chain acyl-CoA synthetase